MKQFYSRITAAESPALAVERAKMFLRIDISETDAEMIGFIAAATEFVEKHSARALSLQSWRLSLDVWPTGDAWYSRAIEINRTPLVAVSSVKYYPIDGSAQVTLSAANYSTFTDTEPGFVYFPSTLTLPEIADRPDAIQVLFTAGNATADGTDELMIQAIQLLVGDADTMRSATITGTIVSPNPRFNAIMNQLRVGGFAA